MALLRPTIRSVATSVLAMSLITLLLAADGRAARGQTGNQAVQLSIAFGPSQVWQPSPAAIGQLQRCTDQNFTCVRGVMQTQGASAEAVAFYRLTGWFLSDLQDTGVVQLGTIFTPWAANENTQLALLGGIPAVIFPNQAAATFGGALAHDPTYAAIASAHEDAMYWPFGPTLAGVETSPAGGPRFLLKYRVLDGCHACATLAQVRLAFDFAADGTEAGVHLIEVIPQVTP